MKEGVQGIPVCIVIPPSEFLADERVFPFLGPLKGTAELRRNGNPVDVLNLLGYSNPEDIIWEDVRASNTVFFGLTATTPQIPAAVRVRNEIREMLPEAKIILCGPHVTLTYAARIQDEKLGRIGRGTMAFSQLEECLDMNIFETVAGARLIIEMWRKGYENIRPHSGLKGRTPKMAAMAFIANPLPDSVSFSVA